MKSNSDIDDRYLNLAYIVLFAALLWTIASLAPVLHDDWGHYMRHRLLGDDFIRHLRFYSPARGNPRIGEIFLLVSYFDAPVHPFLATTFTLLFFLAASALVLGHWPKLSRQSDTLTVLTLACVIFWGTHHAGEMFFYRPFLTNYVYGLTVTFLALLPLRLRAFSSRSISVSLFTFVLGALGGLSNEHTGPAGIVVFAAFLSYRSRESIRIELSQWTAMVGYVAGYLFLFFAPGQSVRYDRLSTKTSLLENVLQRGFMGNLDFLTRAAFPYIATLVVVLLCFRLLRASIREVPRVRIVLVAVHLLAAQLIAVTSLASPILGDRLLFASTVVGLMGCTTLFLELLRGRTQNVRWMLHLSAFGVALFLLPSLAIYARTRTEFESRVRMLMEDRIGRVVEVPPYTYWQRSHFFFGDDLVSDERRKVLSREILNEGMIELTRDPRVTGK